MTDDSTVVSIVPIERFSLLSRRSFDDVVDAIYDGLGRSGDFAGLLRRWNDAGSREEFDRITESAVGSSGLIEFMTLDLGAVLATREPSLHYRMLRIIAGNPVTMSKLTMTVPDAGSYVPVTILVAERPNGVYIAYDKICSAVAPYDSPDAAVVARDLDESVLELLHFAATLDENE